MINFFYFLSHFLLSYLIHASHFRFVSFRHNGMDCVTGRGIASLRSNYIYLISCQQATVILYFNIYIRNKKSYFCVTPTPLSNSTLCLATQSKFRNLCCPVTSYCYRNIPVPKQQLIFTYFNFRFLAPIYYIIFIEKGT